MTDTTMVDPLEGVPLAETLDEATLRRVFPNAPADLVVPRDVKSMFSARMRTVGGEQHTFLVAMLIGSFVAAAVLALSVSVLAGGIVAGVALVALVVVAILEHGKAADDFFDRYSTARGLVHGEDGHIGANVPLFARGDERKWPRVLAGTIAGQDAKLGTYVYTEVSRDSDGNRTETDYPFTVLHFTLPPSVAARFVGVYCGPRSISFGALQDKLAHDRKVELESQAFHRRYSLRVVDEQDDIALYELFSTTFIQRLATEVEVHWEQRGSDLVCYRRGQENEAADFDRFCLESWYVLHRYLEEWQ